jgi:DNA (cytosine-5)-methyltransferase 1
MPTQKPLKICSLFCGIGGICLAAKKNGFNIAIANDIDKYCCETYKLNFPETRIVNSCIFNFINRKDVINAQFSVITGGFPCQSFSIAGNREGLKDKRGETILAVFEFLRKKQRNQTLPNIIVLENVKHLKNHNSGETLNFILSSLSSFGYHMSFKVFNALKYTNICQNRERLIIIGALYRKIDLNKIESLDSDTLHFSFQEDNVDKKYYYNRNKYPKYERFLKEIEADCKNNFFQIRRGMYVRKHRVCPTFTANMGTGGHNVPLIKDNLGIRKLTPKECFNLMGFPKSYKYPLFFSDCILYKQVGNSVVVPLFDKIFAHILKQFDEASSTESK